ncbi:helix-turn-helix domain-containing protein [Erwinia sp. E602]|uniref:helix-turn-helix domain-containing protein n=1 Tax=Erwinia sp. E602 TaxID=2675378 RepID=UPI001BA8EFD9|nr:helix-turn-helix transcriptional regulator [Erwinia sp. E602]QUG73891.1 helix-turn-helix domain-containing protein [Erwinia sp. E602]
MNHETSETSLARLQTIATLVDELKNEFAAGQRESAALTERQKIHSLPALGAQLNQRRKALGIDLATLELQTGLSVSTLKRLFKDPEQVKFGSVYVVADALGVTLCAVV